MAPRTTPLAASVVDAVTASFEAARDADAAPGMRAYMRDQFDFLGIPAKARERLGREAIAGLARPTEADAIAVALAMWARDEREYQYFACWYLRRFVKVLGPGFLPTAEHLLVTRSWWDTVDELAQNVVGDIVLRHRELGAVMDEWIESDDIWLARTAILHQNRWKAETDAERLFRYCERRAGDREFFIRKAIGWALREHTRVDAPAVRRFVETHDEVLSGLSKREALKWLERRAARADG